jgi:hypothetical protein
MEMIGQIFVLENKLNLSNEIDEYLQVFHNGYQN